MRQYLLILLTPLLAVVSMGASIYKWVDEKGIPHYSDIPPRSDRKAEEMHLAPQPPNQDMQKGQQPTQKSQDEQQLRQQPAALSDVLQDRVLEVGQGMGWSKVYENRAEGLFVWHFQLDASAAQGAGNQCGGLFAWYIKRVEDKVALDDPILFDRTCPPEPRRLGAEARRLQELFKRRWLDLVGAVTLISPSAATHSQKLLGQVLSRLYKEGSEPPISKPPTE